MKLDESDLRWLASEFKAVRDEITLRAALHDEVHVAHETSHNSETRRGVKWTGISTGIGATLGAVLAGFVAVFYKPQQ